MTEAPDSVAKIEEAMTEAPDSDAKIAETAIVTEAPHSDTKSKMKNMKLGIAFLSLSTVGLLIATIVLATKDSSSSNSSDEVKNLEEEVAQLSMQNDEMKEELDAGKQDYGDNPCAGMRPNLPNVQCLQELEDGFSPGQDIDPEVFTTGPQSGVNVTKGYNGMRNVTYKPITEPYREKGLCPVNVHWHIGSEHYSMGEFDENGKGPIDFHEGRQGFRCSYYDASDEKFTKQFDWQHCIGMTVGQTYEVHWPHSAAGDCNTPWQYQTPFYDGVFCNLPFENFQTLTPQDIANNVGVQSQTFVVVNDEEYYYPDLFGGMIVDAASDKGVDLAIYTGSTTGTQRNNEVCSPFTPITWQVDRKCHMVSASSFERMCKQMDMQADSMKDDLYAHGSRELVINIHAANNHNNRARELRRLRHKST